MRELPRCKRDFEHVLIFENLFSHYITCVPLRARTSAAVRNAIGNILCTNYGILEKVISDNGKEFINQTVQKFLKESAMTHGKTPVYHPQSNPVDCVNRVIKTMIASFIESNHKKWDKYCYTHTYI